MFYFLCTQISLESNLYLEREVHSIFFFLCEILFIQEQENLNFLHSVFCNLPFFFLFQIRRCKLTLRCKEGAIHGYMRDDYFEEVRLNLGNLTRKDCKIAVKNYVDSKTLLYRAVLSRNRNMMSFLVECGANVNELVRQEGYCPLLMAVIRLGDLSMIRTLEKLGADLHKKDKKGANAIVNAVENQEMTIARYLQFRNVSINCSASVLRCSKNLNYLERALKLNFDVNYPGLCQNTAFILATHMGNVDILKTLRENNANIYHRNSWGRNAFNEALCRKISREVKTYLRSIYNRNDYIECIEYTGADLMIFEDNLKVGYFYWETALKLRERINFPRKENIAFADTIGQEIDSSEQLQEIKNDSLKLLLQALLIFLRVLPKNHCRVFNAMVSVASDACFMDHYVTTINILTDLVAFHDPSANLCTAAGYKAMKCGLIVFERSISLNPSLISEEILSIRFELLFFFIKNNVWLILILSDKTILTYFHCYKQYLILFLDLLNEYFNVGITCKTRSFITIILSVIIAMKIPLYPITLLHVAVEKEYSLVIIKHLLECGCSAIKEDIDGNTALDFACAYDETVMNRNEIIELLVNFGGDRNAVKVPVYRSPIARKRSRQKICIVHPVKSFERRKKKRGTQLKSTVVIKQTL